MIVKADHPRNSLKFLLPIWLTTLAPHVLSQFAAEKVVGKYPML